MIYPPWRPGASSLWLTSSASSGSPSLAPSSTSYLAPTASAFSSSSDFCRPEHDIWSLSLGLFLCVGLVVSYAPQLIRIVLSRSSLGFSPWFLLLGATSSASSFLNVVTLQWGVVRCCTKITSGQCFESLVGVIQVGLQWALFSSIFVLFLFYYPVEKRYERSVVLTARSRRPLSRTDTIDGTEDGEDDEDDDEDDGSSIGDIDSVASHIATNYSTFDNTAEHSTPRGNEATANTATQRQNVSFDSPEASGYQSRFAGVDDNAPASSSAFDRLVPTFWPMWKAPKQEQQKRKLTPSKLGPGALSSSSPATSSDALLPANATPAARASAEGSSGGNAGASTSAISQRRDSRRSWLGAPEGLRPRRRRKTVKHKSPEWSLAVALAWVTALHFLFVLLVTLLLVATLPTTAFPPPSQPAIPIPPVGSDPSDVRTPPILSPPSLLQHGHRDAHHRHQLQGPLEAFGPSSRLLVNRWAAFLGVTGTLLAAAQYVPQIVHTARTRLVGSLSIPMMLLQVPGSAIFVYSLAIRPGIDWTSLAAYAAAGALQAVLLVLCLFWKRRQAKEGIDDYGRKLQGVQLYDGAEED